MAAAVGSAAAAALARPCFFYVLFLRLHPTSRHYRLLYDGGCFFAAVCQVGVNVRCTAEPGKMEWRSVGWGGGGIGCVALHRASQAALPQGQPGGVDIGEARKLFVKAT